MNTYNLLSMAYFLSLSSILLHRISSRHILQNQVFQHLKSTPQSLKRINNYKKLCMNELCLTFNSLVILVVNVLAITMITGTCHKLFVFLLCDHFYCMYYRDCHIVSNNRGDNLTS